MAQDLENYEIHFHEIDKQVFRYPSRPTNTDGCFRLVHADPLLHGRGKSSIRITQFHAHYDFERAPLPQYVALSHVWASSKPVLETSKQADRPLLVQVPGYQHDISWHGLQQSASVAKLLGYEYLWLDFLCLNQLSKKDKALQIPNMGNVYKNAGAVLVMIGGIQAAHDLHSSSSWMERAWTLQEATLNRDTFVLFQWEKEGHGYLYKDGSTCWIRKMLGGIAYASLVDLLAMVGTPPKLTLMAEYDVVESALETEGQNESADNDDASSKSSFDVFYDMVMSTATGYDAEDVVGKSDEEIRKMLLEPVAKETPNQGFQRIECFNFSSQAGQMLRDIINTTNPATRITSVWNSLWLRASTKPQDIVYGSMHLFGVTIPVDYSRELADLVFEVASQTLNSPGWLTLGAFEHDGLVPIPPPLGDNTHMFDVTLLASNLVRPQMYLDFDIRILKLCPDQGQHFCARILSLSEWTRSESASHKPQHSPYKKICHVRLISNTGRKFETECRFDGELGRHVVFVGQQFDIDAQDRQPDVSPTIFVIFLDRPKYGKWHRSGTGVIGIGYNDLIQNTVRKHCQLFDADLTFSDQCDC